MNSLGRLFRVSIFGESHGPGIGVVLDGCPAGIPLTLDDFKVDQERRRGGGKGKTPRAEKDLPEFKSGVFNELTTGAPLTIFIASKDVNSSWYDENRSKPRPGHADFVAHTKFGGFQDYRGGGHFSGRLTAALVAAGVVAKKIIDPIRLEAKVISVGGSEDIDRAIEDIVEEGDSLGGIVECKITNVPVGLGEPFFNSVESMISHAAFSIPAIKGIEFGSGFKAAEMKGSEHNDVLISDDGKTATNNAAGINGGITNSNEIVFRVAVKPTSSISKNQKTIEIGSGKQTELSVRGRHDACIALRVPPVIEAAAAIVLADFMVIEQKIPRIW